MKRKSTNAQLLDKESKKIYTNFKNFLDKNLIEKHFAVGVSGGPDSLALVYFSKIYSLEKKFCFRGIIIDHGIRADSDLEAKKVKKILLKHDIKTTILKIKISNSKNLHLEARKKRYDEIINFCYKKKIKNILLGHHLDDQIENFYIRLSRGSGLAGLSPIKKNLKMKKINFLRPLLDINKNQLVKIAKKYFNFYVNDPSNHDDKYLRSRLRKLRISLKNEGFDDKKFAKTLDNLNKANVALQFYSDLAIKRFFVINNNHTVISKKLFLEPYEIIFRSISIFLTKDKDYPPRSKGIDYLIDELSHENKKKVTLGGYIFKNGLKSVIVNKEVNKR